MSTGKELLIAPGETPELHAGETATLILRGEPRIRFQRDRLHYSHYGEEAGTPVLDGYSSPVVSPIPKMVLERLKLAKRQPEPSALLNVRVEGGPAFDGKLVVQAGKSTEVEMIRDAEGWVSRKPLLFTHGDGQASAADFPEIQIIDISKGGEVGFETEAVFEAGPDRRKLGFIDLLIKDEADGAFRSCRYGVFKTRTPILKLVCPGIGANNTRILLDDGQDVTVDCLDITTLMDPTGLITDKPDMPQAVSELPGEWDPQSTRSRIYDIPPEEGKSLGLFMLGENRLRVIDTFSNEVLFTGHFLLFESEEQVVVGTWYGTDPDSEGEDAATASTDHLLLDFKPGTPPVSIASTLWAWHLVPQGFAPEYGILQCSPHIHLPAKLLGPLAENIAGAGMPDLESAGLDRPLESPEAVTSRFPEAYRADFNAGTGTFNNAFQWYFHHFYMHTFPAHRLIDHVRFGTNPAPSVILEGSHFLNKTFLQPSCRASLNALFQARNDFPGMKLAVFGHADSSGTDVHNTQLSQFRADIAHALLIKDPDVWLRRLDGSALVVETPWGTREIQSMLKALGHYSGPVNGVDDAPTRQANRKLLQKHGLPDNGSGRLDRAARRQLIQDYMDNLVPAPMQPADFFRDAAGNPALYAAGENHPLIPSDPANPQNRRVTFILRARAPVPIDLTQRGAAAPYPQWIAPEPDPPAQGADNPPFIVGCWDSGFGNGDNLSGERLDAPSRLFIRGRRLVRPTLIGASGVNTHRVFRDGDLSGSIVSTSGGAVMAMTDSAGPHGSMVMSSMTADGVGDDVGGVPRIARNAVLGTGKDVKFRPMKVASGTTGADFLGALQRYNLLASDPEVKVVSTSQDVRHFRNTNAAGNAFLTNAQQNALIAAVRRMCKSANSNKLYFLAAANRRFEPENVAKRDVARTEGGALAPSRSVKRGDLTGNNEFKRNVACVGASSQALAGGASAGDKLLGVHTAGIPEFPTFFTFLGEEVSFAAPGENVRVMSSTAGAPLMGGPAVNANGVFIVCTDGTSFSTPFSAGIAAELMLANPALQQPANMPKVIEMMEATADLLPSLSAAPANRQGLYLPGAAANPDPQLTAGDLAGFRRLHFWKAVLAALNDGLPSEQQIPNPAGGGSITATSHFKQLTGRDHASTTWYGFEVRSPLAACGIFLKRQDGSFLRIEDTQAALPQGRRLVDTWLRAQDYKAVAGHPQAGFVLPNFPFTGAPPANVTFWFMTQFSVKREELARYSHIAVFPPGIDPSAEGMGRAPTLSLLNLSLIARMRNPGAITAPERAGNPDLARIAAHIQEFDDFVFHWTLAPGALQGFVLVHREGAAAAEDIPVTVFAVDAQGNLKPDFAGNVNITHTGTNGSTAGGVNRGVFINGAAAGASTPIALANGTATFQVRNHTVQNFRLAVGDGAGHSDDGASPLINVGPPGRSHGIRVETTHHDGRAVDAHPPRVGDRLKYIVTILDDQERTKTNFTGRVELKVTEGTMGSDVAGGVAPFKRGVHVADTQADAFSAARFVHNFVAGDRGRFEFSVFHYTTGPTRLQAVHEALSGDSPRLDIKGGALDHFDFTLPAANLKPGNAANITLRARDRFGNLIDDFSGRVNLSVQPPAMAGAAGAGGNSGVFILNTQTAADDVADFRDADLGAKQFPLTAYTAGNFTLRAVSGAVTSDSAALTVDAPAVLASFGFEVGRNQLNGVQFPVTVIAQDAAGNRIPNFAGAVTLARVSGPAATPLLTPHTYVAADNGRFSFGARATAAGALVLRASSGAIRSDVTITIT